MLWLTQIVYINQIEHNVVDMVVNDTNEDL